MSFAGLLSVRAFTRDDALHASHAGDLGVAGSEFNTQTLWIDEIHS